MRIADEELNRSTPDGDLTVDSLFGNMDEEWLQSLADNGRLSESTHYRCERDMRTPNNFADAAEDPQRV